MYNKKQILSVLGVVGWGPSTVSIAESLKVEDVAGGVEEVHPVLTLNNLHETFPKDEAVWPEHDDSKTYEIGEVVKLAEVVFRKIGEPKETPSSLASHWEVTDDFSEWLRVKMYASMTDTVDKVLKNNVGQVMSILDSKTLFNRPGNLLDRIENKDRIVGLRLDTSKAYGVAVNVNRIGVQFSDNVDFNLYIFNGGQPEHIHKIPVKYTKNGGVQWIESDLVLENESGEDWYIAYDQKELGDVEAANKTKDWNSVSCGPCDPLEVKAQKVWSKYLRVYPFRVPSDYTGTDVPMWDPDTELHSNRTNYGLNVNLTIRCDITEYIMDHIDLFTEAIRLNLACRLLREIAFNPNFRMNRQNTNYSSTELLYEIDGDSSSSKRSGLKHQLDKEIKAVNLDLSQIDSPCFKEDRKRKMRIRSI